jgi:hypothetical protein
VAGVLHSRNPFHLRAIHARRATLQFEAQEVLRATKEGRSAAREIQTIGRNSKEAIRSNIQRSGHVDTGKMLRNTQFEVRSMSGFARFKAKAKAERAFKKFVKGRGR